MEERKPCVEEQAHANASRPEDMRTAVAGYVRELHRAYADQAAMFAPGVRGRMPLMTAPHLNVVAVAARNLHVLATTEDLGPLRGQEVSLPDEVGGVSWELRFYDPVVLPDLALVSEEDAPAFEEVKKALGIGTVVYHFVAQPGAGLSAHQASHVGTGLANSHSAQARDFETIRSRARGREALVDEMAGAAIAGLKHAQALLARAIAPYDDSVREAAEAQELDPDAVRKALLSSVGGRTQWVPDGDDEGGREQ